MSTKKAWRQVSHVRIDDKDSESSISNSKSSVSYQFNKVKFKKTKIDDQKSVKKFGMASMTKARQNVKENSRTKDIKIKRAQSSFLSVLDHEPINLTLKSTKNRQIQMKMKKFMTRIKKVYDDIKQIAEGILINFEKIKEQMQINLLKVTDQILKMDKNTCEVSKVHEIIQKGFSQIRKSIVLLPPSITQFNFSQSQILKAQPQSKISSTSFLNYVQSKNLTSKSRPKIPSIFNQRQHSPIMEKNLNLDLRLVSNEKEKQKQRVRPETQRRKKVHFSPDKQQLRTQNNLPHPPQLTMRTNLSCQSTQGIESIIQQMRFILKN